MIPFCICSDGVSRYDGIWKGVELWKTDGFRLTRVTKETVYKWLSEKDLPAHKIGRLWKFNKEDVDLWVKKQAKTIGNPKK